MPPAIATAATLLDESARSYHLLCAETIRPTDHKLFRRLERLALVDQMRLLYDQCTEFGIRWLVTTGDRPERAFFAGWDGNPNPRWVASGQAQATNLQQTIPKSVNATLGAMLSMFTQGDYREFFFPLEWADDRFPITRAWGLDLGAVPGLVASLEAELIDDALVPTLFAA